MVMTLCRQGLNLDALGRWAGMRRDNAPHEVPSQVPADWVGAEVGRPATGQLFLGWAPVIDELLPCILLWNATRFD